MDLNEIQEQAEIQIEFYLKKMILVIKNKFPQEKSFDNEVALAIELSKLLVMEMNMMINRRDMDEIHSALNDIKYELSRL